MTQWLENGRERWETNSTQVNFLSHPEKQFYSEFRPDFLLLKDIPSFTFAVFSYEAFKKCGNFYVTVPQFLHLQYNGLNVCSPRINLLEP